MRCSRLRLSCEHGDHRYLHLLCERLQRARNLRDLRCPVLARPRNVHELEIVHHHEPESVLALQPAAARAKLGRREGRIVGDEYARVVEERKLRGQARPVVGVQPAGTNLLLVDSTERGEHSHGELLGRHLHAEHEHGQPGPDGSLFHEVHRERGLAHRGTPRDDDQVAMLQARGYAIQVAESGRHAGYRSVEPGQIVDALHDIAEHILDRDRVPASCAVPVRDLEDPALRFIDEVGRPSSLRTKCGLGDFGAGSNQIPQYGAIANNLRVRDDVGGAGRVLGEFREVGKASRRLELAVPIEALGHRHGVARPTLVAQRSDGIEHCAMVAPVETRAREQVGDPVPRAVVEQHAAEHSLLGLHRVRRNPKPLGIGYRTNFVEQRIGHVREVLGAPLHPASAEVHPWQDSLPSGPRRLDWSGLVAERFPTEGMADFRRESPRAPKLASAPVGGQSRAGSRSRRYRSPEGMRTGPDAPALPHTGGPCRTRRRDRPLDVSRRRSAHSSGVSGSTFTLTVASSSAST